MVKGNNGRRETVTLPEGALNSTPEERDIIENQKLVRDYFKELSKRLKSDYLGTVIKGNANRLDEQPQWMILLIY